MTINTLKVADASAAIKATLDAQQGARRAARRHDDARRRPAARGAAVAAAAVAAPALLGRGDGARCEGRERSTRSCASPATATTAAAPMPGTAAPAPMAPPLAGSPRVHRSSRLRDQGAAARPDRTDGRHDLHRSHDSDGPAERRVDCRGRRRTSATRSATARRSSRRLTSRASAGDAQRARDVDVSGESRRRCRRQVVSIQAGSSRPATTRHRPLRRDHPAVDSGVPQAPGMWLQVELPQPVMLTEIAVRVESARRSSPGRSWPARRRARSRRRRRRGRGGARRRAQPPPPPTPPVGYPRGYKVQVSMDGTSWGRPLRQGQGTGATTTSRLRRCARSSCV